MKQRWLTTLEIAGWSQSVGCWTIFACFPSHTTKRSILPADQDIMTRYYLAELLHVWHFAGVFRIRISSNLHRGALRACVIVSAGLEMLDCGQRFPTS